MRTASVSQLNIYMLLYIFLLFDNKNSYSSQGSPKRTTVSNKDTINTSDPKSKNLKPYIIDGKFLNVNLIINFFYMIGIDTNYLLYFIIFTKRVKL